MRGGEVREKGGKKPRNLAAEIRLSDHFSDRDQR